MRKSPHRSVGRLAVAAMLMTTMAVDACSSDGKSASASSTPTTTAPEQKISTDAEVASGLSQLQTLVDDLETAGPNTQKAAAARDAMTPVWLDIEGTIKANEPDIYIDIEDSLALLSASVEGDEEKGAVGVADIRASFADYLSQHPA